MLRRILNRPFPRTRWQAQVVLLILMTALYFASGMNPIPPLLFLAYLGLVLVLPWLMRRIRK